MTDEEFSKYKTVISFVDKLERFKRVPTFREVAGITISEFMRGLV